MIVSTLHSAPESARRPRSVYSAPCQEQRARARKSRNGAAGEDGHTETARRASEQARRGIICVRATSTSIFMRMRPEGPSLRRTPCTKAARSSVRTSASEIVASRGSDPPLVPASAPSTSPPPIQARKDLKVEAMGFVWLPLPLAVVTAGRTTNAPCVGTAEAPTSCQRSLTSRARASWITPARLPAATSPKTWTGAPARESRDCRRVRRAVCLGLG